MSFEPEIICFCCNWSGFRNGKTLEGPKYDGINCRTEIYSVDCVGAIPPYLIIEALEKGADGILICSCGEELCIYYDGVKRVDDRISMLKVMLTDLGIEPERLAIEKVPERNGGDIFDKAIKSFADRLLNLGRNPQKRNSKMSPGISAWPQQSLSQVRDIKTIVKKTGVLQCLECGKCTASCPVALVKKDFSPMYIVEKALREMGKELGDTSDVWNCLTCSTCRTRCPSNVDFIEFIRSLRNLGILPGEVCTHGGVFRSVMLHHVNKCSCQYPPSWLTADIKVSSKGEVLYFKGCLDYFDVLFGSIGFNGIREIAHSTVKILNAAGINPVVMGDERCCGHDALWTGHRDTFQKLAEFNAKTIKDAGATTVVTSCPECARTFRMDYPQYVGFDIEVKHISEFVSELLEQKKIGFENSEGLSVSYQDPCRLARHLKVIDEPRRVLNAIGGLKILEMEHNSESSICCGTAAWTNCNAISESIRVSRLQEFMHTGAGQLITSCPKCQIHFKCTLHARPEMRDLDPNIRITDLVTLIASNLKGGLR